MICGRVARGTFMSLSAFTGHSLNSICFSSIPKAEERSSSIVDNMAGFIIVSFVEHDVSTYEDGVAPGRTCSNRGLSSSSLSARRWPVSESI